MKFDGKFSYRDNSYNITDKQTGKNYKGVSHTVRFQTECKKWVEDLANNFNITPRKTHTLQPPNLTDNKMILSFFSGNVDGWIYVEETDYGKHGSIAVMGSKELMEWFKYHLDRLVPNSDGANLKETESENIFEYKISGVKAYWVSKLCLSLEIPRIDRKWNLMKELVQNIESNGDQRLSVPLLSKKPKDEILKEFGIE